MPKPLLKIGPLTTLQDARSSAAVGFDLLTFSLERGNDKKLSVSLIWNMIQWLSGPAIALEMNRFSLEELQDVKQGFDFQYLSMPAKEWGTDLFDHAERLILRADQDMRPKELEAIASESPSPHLWFELHLNKETFLQDYQAILPKSFLHFDELPQATALLSQQLPLGGFSLKEEAEEEPGVLDYEAIDLWLETFNEEYGEE